MAAGRSRTSSSGTGLCPGSSCLLRLLWACYGDCRGVAMLLSAVSLAKSKSKNILVKMISQAGTGYSFNTKRSRLREKLTLLHYDPVVKTKVLFVEQKKIRSL
ncbi:39S ribosomal protein L33, mitochondrial isoform X6 [Pteropus vampyrus]|uniref:Large ribosomal subunit protein bL33m n=2 Tax=Pteropus TaxID=9401 RepID=A0A6P3QU38_PTEVA|nr:39S ribosomal protein L33, mitochondrial isoform X6 [Pteropus vampyrus]